MKVIKTATITLVLIILGALSWAYMAQDTTLANYIMSPLNELEIAWRFKQQTRDQKQFANLFEKRIINCPSSNMCQSGFASSAFQMAQKEAQCKHATFQVASISPESYKIYEVKRSQFRDDRLIELRLMSKDPKQVKFKMKITSDCATDTEFNVVLLCPSISRFEESSLCKSSVSSPTLEPFAKMKLEEPNVSQYEAAKNTWKAGAEEREKARQKHDAFTQCIMAKASTIQIVDYDIKPTDLESPQDSSDNNVFAKVISGPFASSKVFVGNFTLDRVGDACPNTHPYFEETQINDMYYSFEHYGDRYLYLESVDKKRVLLTPYHRALDYELCERDINYKSQANVLENFLNVKIVDPRLQKIAMKSAWQFLGIGNIEQKFKNYEVIEKDLYYEAGCLIKVIESRILVGTCPTELTPHLKNYSAVKRHKVSFGEKLKKNDDKFYFKSDADLAPYFEAYREYEKARHNNFENLKKNCSNYELDNDIACKNLNLLSAPTTFEAFKKKEAVVFLRTPLGEFIEYIIEVPRYRLCG